MKYPKGIVEDVIVKVNEFYYPVDFVVLETEPVKNPESHIPVILGRPFLATSNAVISCRNGIMTLAFGNMTVQLNVFHSSSQSTEMDDLEEIHMIENIISSSFEESSYSDPLERCLANFGQDCESSQEVNALLDSIPVMDTSRWATKFESLPISESQLVSSNVKPPQLELKDLSENLKYAFLGENKTLPVIIASNLTKEQEEKLLSILRKNQEAIGWSIADIKGISPSVVQHKIHLEEDAKISREPQRRLNPIMKDVVRAEVIKLLDAGIIYPISDSQWVSPVQVVPKKSGITMVKNDHNELVPTRVQTGWRVCIDYRKLNAMTRKDHFPLPFIDQMLERLAGHSHYCFLDGYSGYNQVPIAHED